MPHLVVAPPEALPCAGGRWLSLRGDWLAAADLQGPVLWQRGREVASHRSARAFPGRPRLDEGGVAWWGDGGLRRSGFERRLDLEDGPPSRGTAVDQRISAWAPQGRMAPVAAETSDGARLAWAEGGSGQVEREEALQDLAPGASWCARQCALASTRTLPCWTPDGAPAQPLSPAGGLPALRLEAGADEARLPVLRLGVVELHDLDPHGLYAAWPGDWADAALLPCGRAVLACDAAGRLHGAPPGSPMQTLPDGAIGPVDALAADDGPVLPVARAQGRSHLAAVVVEG